MRNSSDLLNLNLTDDKQQNFDNERDNYLKTQRTNKRESIIDD